MEKSYLISKYKSGRPYDINKYYPSKFYASKITTQELFDMVSEGGTEGLYTNMSYMFQSCSSLTTIPLLDTRNVTNMSSMFQSCSSLTTIPQLDTRNVTNMSYMFQSCSSLTTIPQLDTRNVTDMFFMFQYCSSLTTIPQLDTRNVTNNYGMFERCDKLEKISMININANLDIHWSTKMTREALLEVIGNLMQQSGTSKTLTLGATLKAKLTPEDIQIATNKGWTVA